MKEKIVLQKSPPWYDRHLDGDGPVALLIEAGAMVGVAGFFAAMLVLSHGVSLYERLRRR